MMAAEDQTLVLADFTSLRMVHLFHAMEREEFLKELHRPCVELAHRVLSKLPKDCFLESGETSSVLLEWLGLVEGRIRDLCRSNSKQFWLHISRRIRPDAKALDATPETAWLARTTLNLAILKYGLSRGRPFIKIPLGTDLRNWVKGEDDAEVEESGPMAGPPTLVPKTLTRADCIAVYQLEELAFEFCTMAAGLRRAWKGGRLRLQDGLPQGVELDPDTEHLVRLYDARTARYSTILSGFGLVGELDDVLQQHEKGSDVYTSWLLWVPIWNFEGEDVASLFHRGADSPFISNYLLLPRTVQPWYRAAELFKEEIEDVWGVSPKQVVCFLVASSQRHLLIGRQDMALKYQLWQRGYVAIEAERYVQQIAEAYRECCKELFGQRMSLRAAAQEAAHVLAAISYQEADFEKIDLWTRSGTKVVHPMGEILHLDYSMVPGFLAHTLGAIPVTGGAAAMAKGIRFERQAEEVIRNLVPAIQSWDAPRELEFEDGSKRELDLGIILGETMFVCECKSHAVPPGFDTGEPDELWKREEKLRAAVVKADSLARKLASQSNGRNFVVPKVVRVVIPCVLTPFPEYLPERSRRFFFDEGRWPRICVPEEFAEFLRSFSAGEDLDQPFVYEVAPIYA